MALQTLTHTQKHSVKVLMDQVEINVQW